MFVQDQLVEMKWNSRNKEHYVSKGYEYTGKGQTFYVEIEDLTKGVKQKVLVSCDYCGEIFYKSYASCLRKRRSNGKDCCPSCASIKQRDICIEKYGVENPSQIESAKEKRIKTYLDRYGVINPSQVPEFHEKRVQTCLEHYGTKYPMQSIQIQKQAKETCLEKYGVEHYFQTEEFKENNKQYWLENYGVENPMGVPELRNKILSSFNQNGTAPTSKMQIKVSNIVKDIYGEDNVEDDVPYYDYLLDMVLYKDGNKIDIEYDGWYWHKDNQSHDNRRNDFLIKNGYKVLRIRSNYELPTREQIIEGVDYLVKGNHSLKFIDLDIDV